MSTRLATRALAVAVVAAVGATAPRAPAAAAVPRDAMRGAGRYLAAVQAPTGAIPAGGRADYVAEAVTAALASGAGDRVVDRALAFVAEHGPADATSGPIAGRLVLGVTAAGRNPRRFGGVDYVRRIEDAYDPVTGRFGGPNVYADALAMAGLLAAGEEIPDRSLTFLELQQCPDGGFSHREGCLQAADVDTTAMVMSVLIGAGRRASAPVASARSWLAGAQGPSGCWGIEAGDAANANSCGLALSAIAALGEDPAAAPWSGGSRHPVRALVALQDGSGGFRYRATSTEPQAYATVQAVIGLAGLAYPPGRVRSLVRDASSGGAAPASPGDPGASTPADPPTLVRDPAAAVGPSARKPATEDAAAATEATRVRDPAAGVAPIAHKDGDGGGGASAVVAALGALAAAGGGFMVVRRGRTG